MPKAVYEQIETMSETPTHKHRRSKSSQLDQLTPSRDSSPLLEPASGTTSFRSQQSLDGATGSASRSSGSKTSVEKQRGKETRQAHIRSESIRSEGSKQADEVYSPTEVRDISTDSPDFGFLKFAKDAALQREFDDLMRSASTMKMSLTPDRLKTMEVRILRIRQLHNRVKGHSYIYIGVQARKGSEGCQPSS